MQEDETEHPDLAANENGARELARLESLADWLDTRFRIPGTSIRFGLDGLIGLVPGLGDLAMLAPAFYLIARAAGLGAPLHVLARMLINTTLDLVIGAIPILGDIFDVAFKANRRNAALLARFLERKKDRLGR
ncbi:DUF4112 domain-containing protein [uncultured Maricaulis sp.]|uniref:DUF4112 domain-containing protein n=1 Tax=uncultured Maricaulis sp. TaxID=174710 RepID=UPI0030DC5D3A|tara:strand:- start:10328 stop:10726 length:399 start_codon:yes stop_codon:yes gene_type:complete